MGNIFTFKRFCIKCGKLFRPEGRYEMLCDNCSFHKIKRKNKIKKMLKEKRKRKNG